MSKTPENKDVLHLPIDVQKHFYEDLSIERQTEFPRKISKFSHKLRKKGIETLPVAYSVNGVEPGIYKSPFVRRFKGRNIFDALTYTPDYYPFASKAIYVKKDDDAFNGDNILTSEIKRRDVKTLIITGMNTEACVKKTVIGAFKKCGSNVCIKVVYDLLANNEYLPECDTDPLCHKENLESKILANDNIFWSPRISFVTAAEVLKQYSRRLDPRPAKPMSFVQKIRNMLALRPRTLV